MNELEEPGLRPRRTHLLDQARGDAAAAVDGEARRLVDDDDGLVLEQDRDPGAGYGRGRGRIGDAHGRHPDDVPDREPRLRSDAPAASETDDRITADPENEDPDNEDPGNENLEDRP